MKTERLRALIVALPLLLAACGSEAPSGDPLPPSDPPSASDQPPGSADPLAAAPLHDEARPIDLPSPQAVMLHWGTGRDGMGPERNLDFAIENTTDQAMDVELHIASLDRGQVFELPARHVRVGAKTSVERTVPTESLPVQLVDASVQTVVYGVYQGNDGVQRVAPLEPVWIAHDTDFRAARIRSQHAEASNNAQRGLSRLLSVDRARGRALDRAGSYVPLSSETPADNAVRRTAIVSQFGEVLDAYDFDESPPSEERPSGPVDKGGTYTICVQTPHFYVDSQLGEDYLTSQVFLPPEKYEPARYWYYAIYKDGTWPHQGYFNASGCTQPGLTHVNGDYAIFVTSKLSRPWSVSSNLTVNITPDNTQQFQFFIKGYTISGSGGTINLDMTGTTTWSNAGAVAANSIFRQTFAFSPVTMNIYADQSCPGSCGTGTCTACRMPEGNTGGFPAGIYLGPDPNNIPNTTWKYVVAHELGHEVQAHLWGFPDVDFLLTDTPAPPDSCECHDDVPDIDNSHCLQSREQMEAAQVEGFAHFFAADGLNNTSESNCIFNYYKIFREDSGTPVQPPVTKSCVEQVRWMENHCNATDRGTEYDWMGFYYHLKNKSSTLFSFSDFNVLYRTACGSSATKCDGTEETPWATLQTVVNGLWGANSKKAKSWSTTGANFGVNH